MNHFLSHLSLCWEWDNLSTSLKCTHCLPLVAFPKAKGLALQSFLTLPLGFWIQTANIHLSLPISSSPLCTTWTWAEILIPTDWREEVLVFLRLFGNEHSDESHSFIHLTDSTAEHSPALYIFPKISLPLNYSIFKTLLGLRLFVVLGIQFYVYTCELHMHTCVYINICTYRHTLFCVLDISGAVESEALAKTRDDTYPGPDFLLAR